MANATLTEAFSCATSCHVSNQFKQVAKLVHARASFKTERAAFVLGLGGFDQHSNFVDNIGEKFTQMNSALDSFVKEMKAQKVWNDVAVLTISEFGRTLSTNGLGTDHAWGGNVHLLGGGVKGSQVLGKYPTSFEKAGDHNLGRGRMIPSTSWEAIWNGLAEWWGVEPSRMSTVLPNKKNFPSNEIFTRGELFD